MRTLPVSIAVELGECQQEGEEAGSEASHGDHQGQPVGVGVRALMADAAEDRAGQQVGLAVPEALNLCLSAREAMHFLGSPEGDLALAQAVVYLALAPKSNAVYTAYGEVRADVHARVAEPVPLHLRNAPTKLMKELDYGKGYQYAHDLEAKVADMECLPPSLAGKRYYQPTDQGRERQLGQRMEELARRRKSQAK